MFLVNFLSGFVSRFCFLTSTSPCAVTRLLDVFHSVITPYFFSSFFYCLIDCSSSEKWIGNSEEKNLQMTQTKVAYLIWNVYANRLAGFLKQSQWGCICAFS